MYLAHCRPMNTRQLCAASSALVAALSMNACCGGEQHDVAISAPDLFTVNVGNNTLLMYSNTHLTTPPLNPSTLDFVFNTLEGSTSGEGVTLTLRGSEATSNQAMMLSLALPVALRTGDVYNVGGTFTNDPGLAGDAAAYGPYDLAQPNQAEVGFNVSTYTFPPAEYDVNYRATSSSGTVRVTQHTRGQLELMVDLSFVDATGKPATLTGRVLAIAERFDASCS